MTEEYSDSLPYGMYWVIPGKLLAGPNPGAWNEAQARQRVRRLLDLGVTFFIDLTESSESRGYHDLLNSEAMAMRREATYRQMSIVDMDVPSHDHMAAILDMIDMAINRGRTVYVHCMAGLGRTGTIVGCYLVRHGMAGDEALDEIVRLRGGRTDSPQTDEQCLMVRNWREDDIL